MIIGKKFIWMHFPKCAGTFTENLLKKHFLDDPGVNFDKIDPTNIIWHQNIAQREKRTQTDLSDKAVICNFRRLPTWILSRVNYETARSGFVVPREMLIHGRFLEMNRNESYADKVLEKFTERTVHYWIRVEYLEADFIKAFGNFLDVGSCIHSSDFRERTNATEQVLNPVQWFTDDELKTIYGSNPRWSSLEKDLYGALLPHS